MELAAPHQAPGNVGGLECRALGWGMGRKIAGDRDENVLALAGIFPRSELPDSRLQHLIGMEACVFFSCKQLGSFCCGPQAGRSTASGSGSLAPLSACIRTFWPQLSPTSWHGSPGPCWHRSAAMKRASQRQQPNENAEDH